MVILLTGSDTVLDYVEILASMDAVFIQHAIPNAP